MPHPPPHRLAKSDRDRLCRIVEQLGVSGAARLLGVSRSVVAAAAGGIGVRRGSLELVRGALESQRQSGGKAK